MVGKGVVMSFRVLVKPLSHIESHIDKIEQTFHPARSDADKWAAKMVQTHPDLVVEVWETVQVLVARFESKKDPVSEVKKVP